MSSAQPVYSTTALFNAYMAGRMSAQREFWMREARRDRGGGKHEFVNLSVRWARECNRDLVRYYRTLRAVAP